MGLHGKPLTVAKYMTQARPGHPTAHADGRVRVHRANLYDKIGPGPHDCTWCGTEIDWYAAEFSRDLVADHVDRDTWNNDPENLVPSCNRCNMNRHAERSAPVPKTHCHAGHEFTEDNTYHRPDGKGRQCRECNRARELRKSRHRRPRAA
jgi:hypothetical protein